MSTSPQSPIDKEVQETYVARLRARLARPKITIADARDGMLDCYVSTYHTGIQHGLKGILGVDASPDQVAQLTSRMFRDRLKKHGSSFDEPSVEALSELKVELDDEFHFAELPVEVSATHDQVCSLLLAKADGLMDHHGDQTVVRPQDPPAPAAATSPSPRVSPNAGTEVINQGVRRSQTRFGPPPQPAPSPRSAPTAVPATVPLPPNINSVTENLRRALSSYLSEIQQMTDSAPPQELVRHLQRAGKLAHSIADFSD